MIQEHLAEVQQELLEPEDCTLCDHLRPQAGDTLIYDQVIWFRLVIDPGDPSTVGIPLEQCP